MASETTLKASRMPKALVFLAAAGLLVITAIVPFVSLVALAVLFGLRKRLGRRELRILTGAAIIGLVLQLTWIAILYVVPLQGSTVFH